MSTSASPPSPPLAVKYEEHAHLLSSPLSPPPSPLSMVHSLHHVSGSERDHENKEDDDDIPVVRWGKARRVVDVQKDEGKDEEDEDDMEAYKSQPLLAFLERSTAQP